MSLPMDASISFTRAISDIFGGQEGLPGIAPLPNLWMAMYLAVFALLACLFILRRVINQDYGLVMQSIRENDRAVMSGGINIYWFKAQALFIAAAICAFAGAFMAHYFRFIGPSAFAMDYSILPVAGVILGGPGTFAGVQRAARDVVQGACAASLCSSD